MLFRSVVSLVEVGELVVMVGVVVSLVEVGALLVLEGVVFLW